MHFYYFQIFFYQFDMYKLDGLKVEQIAYNLGTIVYAG